MIFATTILGIKSDGWSMNVEHQLRIVEAASMLEAKGKVLALFIEKFPEHAVRSFLIKESERPVNAE